MKRFLALLMVAALCTAFEPNIVPKHGALLTIDTLGCDFGTIPGAGSHSQTITIRNAGDSDLHITEVHPSCGCTIVSLKDSILPPGGATGIPIRFQETEHWPGHFQKAISIYSNSRDSAAKTFWFCGTFIEPPGWNSARTQTYVKTK